MVFPSLRQNSAMKSLKNGAFLGFLAYSTFELTSLAVITKWPMGLVWIDILWGTILTGLVSAISTVILQKLRISA